MKYFEPEGTLEKRVIQDKETNTQRDYVICLRLHSLLVQKLGS